MFRHFRCSCFRFFFFLVPVGWRYATIVTWSCSRDFWLAQFSKFISSECDGLDLALQWSFRMLDLYALHTGVWSEHPACVQPLNLRAGIEGYLVCLFAAKSGKRMYTSTDARLKGVFCSLSRQQQPLQGIPTKHSRVVPVSSFWCLVLLSVNVRPVTTVKHLFGSSSCPLEPFIKSLFSSAVTKTGNYHVEPVSFATRILNHGSFFF